MKKFIAERKHLNTDIMKKNLFTALAALVMGVFAVSSCNEQKLDLNGEWKVVELDGTAIDLAEVPTVSFADGTYSMFAGVNTVNGAFVVDGEAVVLEDGAMTKMMGAPEEMAVEDRLVSLLGKKLNVKVEGEELVLSLDETPVIRLSK